MLKISINIQTLLNTGLVEYMGMEIVHYIQVSNAESVNKFCSLTNPICQKVTAPQQQLHWSV